MVSVLPSVCPSSLFAQNKINFQVRIVIATGRTAEWIIDGTRVLLLFLQLSSFLSSSLIHVSCTYKIDTHTQWIEKGRYEDNFICSLCKPYGWSLGIVLVLQLNILQKVFDENVLLLTHCDVHSGANLFLIFLPEIWLTYFEHIYLLLVGERAFIPSLAFSPK